VNRSELRRKLEARGINRSLFRLDGGTPSECYTLEAGPHDWAVYYAERGHRRAERRFPTEGEACDFLFAWILEDPDATLTAEQIAMGNARTRQRQAAERQLGR
jgi:hypothetical protein